jgi:MoaA/NifB/PqqE/SkfB family radical SAM enzyme
MSNRQYSFTSANSFPVKIVKNSALMSCLLRGVVPAWHLQLNPTNKCNFSCGFCSCGKRDVKQELLFDDLVRFLSVTKGCGLNSITITGGGEPLAYTHIEELIDTLYLLNIDAGLVCNGSLLHTLSDDALEKLTWCRISSSDQLKNQINVDDWFSTVHQTVDRIRHIDWAFSHVLSKWPQYSFLKRLITFANYHNFTHVRLVSDLLDIDSVPSMTIVQWNLEKLGTDDSKVIYQGRKEFVRGAKKCYISLLKPIIGADGGIYPCCGVMYALKTPGLDYEKSMRMGNWFDLPDLIKEQKFFDGSNCVRCYYDEYNQVLDAILSKTEHVRFV